MSLFGQFGRPPNATPPMRSASATIPQYSSFPMAGSNVADEIGDLVDDDDDDIIEEAVINMGGRNNFNNYQTLSKEMALLKRENESIKNAVLVLQDDRDRLRVAIRKIKVENSRFKAKLKRMATAITSKRQASSAPAQADGGDVAMEAGDHQSTDAFDDLEDDVDFEDIGDFLLIGGPNDPLSAQYRAPIRVANGEEHKSLERYMWYKMAETFNDQEAMKKILTSEAPSAAEEAMKNIKNFDQKAWDAVKMRHFEEAQRAKFEQYRSLKCLLVKTGKHYLAIACQDKYFGTGWRKVRDEAARPHMWDGENRGGKFLMKLRSEYAASHTWATPAEEHEAQNSFYDNRRNVWRKTKRDNNDPRPSSRGRGSGYRGNGQQRIPNRGTVASLFAPEPSFSNVWQQQPQSYAPTPSYYPSYMGPTNGAAIDTWTNWPTVMQDFPKRRGGARGGNGNGTGFSKRGRF